MSITRLRELSAQVKAAGVTPTAIRMMVETAFDQGKIDEWELTELVAVRDGLDDAGRQQLEDALRARLSVPVYSREQVRREALWHDKQAKELDGQIAVFVKAGKDTKGLEAKAEHHRSLAKKQRDALLTEAAHIERSSAALILQNAKKVPEWLSARHTSACQELAMAQINAGAAAKTSVDMPRELTSAKPEVERAGGAGYYLDRAESLTPALVNDLRHQSIRLDYTNARVSAARDLNDKPLVATTLSDKRAALIKLLEIPETSEAARSLLLLERSSVAGELVDMADEAEKDRQDVKRLEAIRPRLSAASQASEAYASALEDRAARMQAQEAAASSTGGDLKKAFGPALHAAKANAADARTQAQNTASIAAPSELVIQEARERAAVSSTAKASIRLPRSLLHQESLDALEQHAAGSVQDPDQVTLRAGLAANIAERDHRTTLGNEAAALALSSLTAATRLASTLSGDTKRAFEADHIAASMQVANGIRRQRPSSAAELLEEAQRTIERSVTLDKSALRKTLALVGANVASEAFNPLAASDASFARPIAVAKDALAKLPESERESVAGSVELVSGIPARLREVVDARKATAKVAGDRAMAELDYANAQGKSTASGVISKAAEVVFVAAAPIVGVPLAIDGQLPSQRLEHEAALLAESRRARVLQAGETTELDAFTDYVNAHEKSGNFQELVNITRGLGEGELARTLRTDRTDFAESLAAVMRGASPSPSAHVGFANLATELVVGEAQTHSDALANDAFFRYGPVARATLELIGEYVLMRGAFSAVKGTAMGARILGSGARAGAALRSGLFGTRVAGALQWTERAYETSRAYRIASGAAKGYAVLGAAHLASAGAAQITDPDTHARAALDMTINALTSLGSAHAAGFKSAAAALALPMSELALNGLALPSMVRDGSLTSDEANMLSDIAHWSAPSLGAIAGSKLPAKQAMEGFESLTREQKNAAGEIADMLYPHASWIEIDGKVITDLAAARAHHEMQHPDVDNLRGPSRQARAVDAIAEWWTKRAAAQQERDADPGYQEVKKMKPFAKPKQRLGGMMDKLNDATNNTRPGRWVGDQLSGETVTVESRHRVKIGREDGRVIEMPWSSEDPRVLAWRRAQLGLLLVASVPMVPLLGETTPLVSTIGMLGSSGISSLKGDKNFARMQRAMAIEQGIAWLANLIPVPGPATVIPGTIAKKNAKKISQIKSE
jgi:hypothetical protein